jgi:hypothetical protein
VDPALLVSLDARVGDTITLGYGRFTIAGALRERFAAHGPWPADALAELDVRYLDEEELEAVGVTRITFANLNTPGDYREFLDALRRSG